MNQWRADDAKFQLIVINAFSINKMVNQKYSLHRNAKQLITKAIFDKIHMNFTDNHFKIDEKWTVFSWSFKLKFSVGATSMRTTWTWILWRLFSSFRSLNYNYFVEAHLPRPPVIGVVAIIADANRAVINFDEDIVIKSHHNIVRVN